MRRFGCINVNLLAPYVTHEMELKRGERLQPVREQAIVYRDNLFFDEFYIKDFHGRSDKRETTSPRRFSCR